MYVYLFLKMGVWVTNSSIIKLLLSSNLLFSNFSCASDWRDFSDDKVPESIAPFEKSFSAILYCTLASMRASACYTILYISKHEGFGIKFKNV